MFNFQMPGAIGGCRFYFKGVGLEEKGRLLFSS